MIIERPFLEMLSEYIGEKIAVEMYENDPCGKNIYRLLEVGYDYIIVSSTLTNSNNVPLNRAIPYEKIQCVYIPARK